MVRALPAVAAEGCFALKGGTAINLFVRNMPRLSVDIDLTYVPLESRPDSLRAMSAALQRVSTTLQRSLRAEVVESRGEGENVTKLYVRSNGAEIKIEPNLNIRGTVFPCQERTLVAEAEALFERSVSINTASLPDLYGGKLCAALDRQHPRDLFDVKLLLENEGITDDIRRAFVVYLSSHDRPINELLDPTRLDVRQTYESQFLGMTAAPVDYEVLLAARESLIDALRAGLTGAEKDFLLSLKKGEPDWNLLGLDGVERLPGVQWKLLNVRRMSAARQQEMLSALKKKLGCH
ncbi:MAG: nucleotidyl transferase AbiEii/AbiGii toxin family protein [Betaproteobacteria bacterium]